MPLAIPYVSGRRLLIAILIVLFIMLSGFTPA